MKLMLHEGWARGGRALLSLTFVAAIGCATADPPNDAEAYPKASAIVPPPAELDYLLPGEDEPEETDAATPADDGFDPLLTRPGEHAGEEVQSSGLQTIKPDDPDEVIRRWILGDVTTPALPERFSGTEADPSLRHTEVDPWIQYLSIDPELEPATREKQLHDLLGSTISDPLRQLILLDLASDLSFKSRRAKFVRRYGFYANWFNRFTYATSRAIQGNLQATAQVVVDALFERFGSEEVTPAERRIYRLLRQLEREGRNNRADQKRMLKLEKRIDEALAESDVEKAEFALEQNNPDLARFYARGAQARNPELRKGRILEERAEASMAARRRRFLASNQVGYPDRDPAFRSDPPELLRAALSRRHSDRVAELEKHETALMQAPSSGQGADTPRGDYPLDPGQEFLLRLLTSLPDQNQAATLAMRQWAETLREAGYAPREETLWLQRLLQKPQFNPDLRLARAQRSRRGHLASFILVGPDSRTEKAYTFASRMTSAFDALAGVGLFYVFEVFYRAGIVAFSPPPPQEEMLDAAAAFVRASPTNRESRKVAAWLIEQYLDAGRFDSARNVLDRYGELDHRKSEELFELEARRLYKIAAALPKGSPEQARLLNRVIETAPGTKVASSAASRIARQEALEREEPWILEASFESVGRWFEGPLPSPFPGRPQWFDGDPSNGEAFGETMQFEGKGLEPESVLLTYSVESDGRIEYVQEWLLLRSYPPEVSRWVEQQLIQRQRAQKEAERWQRPRIPYSVVGGVGLSGVDFYPKLRPIEQDAEDLHLYKDAP